MLNAHTVEEVRRAEVALMGLVEDGALMRRAARGLADHLSAFLAEHGLRSVVMVVGSGDNGGDALYAAVHLAGGGADVGILPVDVAKAHPDGLRAAREAGARIVDDPRGFDLAVDAVVGIGGSPGLREPAQGWFAELAEAGVPVVAVDVPSGVDVDGATTPQRCVRAAATVTFGTYKPALLAEPAGSAASPDGLARLVDIGLGPHLGPPVLEAVEATDRHLLLEALGHVLGSSTHKYARGVVGVAAGSPAYAGAAHLCVAGAQHGPAGMVRFVGDSELCRRVVDRRPEVVAHPDGTEPGRVQAWVVGPGTGDDAERRLAAALDDGLPVVVDADALRFVPDRFEAPALLTPHAGELAAMMDVERPAVEADPLGHVVRAAERWDVTVLLKGARTLVAHTGEATRVNLSGTPWLGTAGAGDVLAGLAGSFLAAGCTPRDAGSLAAFVHGAAGTRASGGGPVVASAVAGALPGVLADWRDGRLLDADVRDWRRA